MNPAVAGDLLLIGSCSGGFYAFDRSSGDLLWVYDTTVQDGYAANFHGQPWVGERTVVVGTDSEGSGYVYALDLATGAARWKHEVPEGVATNVVRIGDAVMAVTLEDRVLALDLATGGLLWSYTREALERENDRDSREFHWTASLADDGHRLFFGSLAGNVTALDAASGKPIWRRDVGARVSAEPILWGDRIYVGTADGTIHRLKPKNGKPVASYALDDAAPMFQLTPFAGGLLVLLEGAETVVALDHKLSRILWRADAEETWSSFRPLVWRDNVLVGDSLGRLIALDAVDGHPRWEHGFEGAVRGLGTDGTNLYVGTLSGWIYVFRPAPSTP